MLLDYLRREYIDVVVSYHAFSRRSLRLSEQVELHSLINMVLTVVLRRNEPNIVFWLPTKQDFLVKLFLGTRASLPNIDVICYSVLKVINHLILRIV